jgi:hypothetical protein
LVEVKFGEPCRLPQVEERTFEQSDLVRITITSSVQTLKKRCFAECRNLSDVQFERGYQLKTVETGVFDESPAEHTTALPVGGKVSRR